VFDRNNNNNDNNDRLRFAYICAIGHVALWNNVVAADYGHFMR
jgi:hypothetical protein